MPDKDPGFRILPASDTFEVSEAQCEGDYFKADIPVFDGIQAQVQHPLRTGPVTHEPGVIGMAITTMGGVPYVMLNMRHADGTSLASVLTVEDFSALGRLYVDTIKRLELFGMPTGGKN